MKRSDPYISGEKYSSTPAKPAQPAQPKQPVQPTQPSGKKLTPHEKRLSQLSDAAKVKPDVVAKIWDEEREKVDKNNSQRWAIVTNNVKKRLGLKG